MWERLNVVKISELLDYLRQDYPVYGDFLKYYTIKIGDLPSEISANLFTVGLFYTMFRNITRGMLKAYIRLALLKSGFVPLLDLEAILEANQNPNPTEIINESRDLTIEILGGYYDEFEEDNPEDYVNVYNPNEGMRIYELTFSPIFMERSIVLLLGDKQTILKDLEKESKIPRLSKFIIVDPLVYSLLEKEVKSLKKEINKELGRDVVLNVYEFIDMIGLDREEFEEEWSEIRENTLKLLKRQFPFLSIYDELWRIKNANSSLDYARSILLKPELTEEDCKDIIRKASESIEALLSVMFHLSKGFSPERKTLGQLLNELRSEIEIEFGEDIYNDLNFIREKRNDVVHPKLTKITYEDALKVIKKAELFYGLFIRKIGLKGD